MNKKIRIQFFLFILFFSIILLSCKKGENSYLNGSLSLVSDNDNYDTLIGKKFTLDSIYSGSMYVYDTLLVFVSNKDPMSKVSVFNLNTKALIGNFCPEGKGPEEATTIYSYGQIFKKGNDVCLWIEKDATELKVLNITQSLRTHKINYGERFSCADPQGLTLNYIFKLDGNEYLAKNQAQRLFKNSYENIPGKYAVYNIRTGKVKSERLIYRKSISSKFMDSDYQIEAVYSTFDMIKPDYSKVALAMVHLPQINILNIADGNIIAVRLKGYAGFKSLEADPKTFKIYNRFIVVDDDYIFVPFVNLPALGMNMLSETNQLYVYNWSGKLVKKFYLDKPFFNLALDRVNKVIYTYDNKDEIYRFDIKSQLLEIKKRN